MDSLEEDLTCSVCYSLFRDPRVLPCSHTFCRGCLDSVLHVSANVSIWRPLRLPLKCPACRSVAELPPAGVEALPANVSLRAIVEKYQRDARPRAPLCAEHPLQPLNVYCVRDRQLICGLCLTVGAHQGHAIDDLQAALERERHAPAALLQRLTDGRWAGLCARAEGLEQERARCHALLQDDRAAVQRYFQGLQGALERRRLAFAAALDAAEAELEEEVGPLRERLKEEREEQLELIAGLSELAEEAEPALAYLQKVHALRGRAESLLATPLPQVPALSVQPRAGEVLDTQWGGVTLAGLDQGPVPPITCCPDTRCRKDTPPCSCPAPEPPGPSPALLTAVLALLVSLCLALIGCSSLGGSALYQACRGVVSDAALCLGSLAENLQLQTGSVLSSLREATAHCLASISDLLFTQ